MGQLLLRCLWWEMYCSFCQGTENIGNQGCCGSSPIDVVDLLPSDPFRMDHKITQDNDVMAYLQDLDSKGKSQVMGSRKGEFESSREVGLSPDVGNNEFDGKADGSSIDKLVTAVDLYDSSQVDDCRGFDGIFLYGAGNGFFEKHVPCGSSLRDVADLLPSDPFGMDAATAFWGITGSFKGLEDIDWSFERGEYENGRTSNGMLFGWNLVYRRRIRFMPNARNDEVETKSDAVSIDRVTVGSDLEELSYFGIITESDDDSKLEELEGYDTRLSKSHGGEPHYAIFLALRYLGVKDLLSVEMVCRSLNYAVKSDPSLWMNINVDHPLNSRLTDDALVKLSSRACGRLKSLTLVGCYRITNTGLKHVIQANPGLIKLSVPNCFRLSIEGMLTTFKSVESLALKQLRIRGLAGATNEQYEQLKVLLCADDQLPSRDHKPLYYHNCQSYLSLDDDRAIDIEKCPRCNEVRLVYDCPAESCQKNEAAPSCKACVLCITRCINCGCCLTNCDYMETFVLDNLCLDCWNKIFSYQEARQQEGLSILNQPMLCEGANYLCFYS